MVSPFLNLAFAYRVEGNQTDRVCPSSDRWPYDRYSWKIPLHVRRFGEARVYDRSLKVAASE